ncbi:hypothetical protein CEY04_22970 [Achromobacter sp. HZ28]|nr:hypothetical protein CEY05_24135 [Achromobacter sp. HZ34]OWT74186.1 hypothetical protein CEY04_22970 [Achromobacter sp. HZ28]
MLNSHPIGAALALPLSCACYGLSARAFMANLFEQFAIKHAHFLALGHCAHKLAEMARQQSTQESVDDGDILAIRTRKRSTQLQATGEVILLLVAK